MAKNNKPDMAWGLVRSPAGWSVATYQIEGNKVVAKKLTEPEIRAVALEQFITATAQAWDDET